MAHTFFVSYRRDDAAAEALNVRSALQREFGDACAFMDTTSIAAGARWASILKLALDTATTVIVVIGPTWLTAGQNEFGQRRIDERDDWVRQELAISLASHKTVVPVRVGGAKLPPARSLPKGLKSLAKLNAIEMRRDYWDHDIKLLLAQLHDRQGGAVRRRTVGVAVPASFPRGPGRRHAGEITTDPRN